MLRACLCFLSFLITPGDSIHEQRCENRNNGHAVVIGADEGVLPVVPAEREEEYHTPCPRRRGIQDDIRPDSDTKGEECFFGFLEAYRDDSGMRYEPTGVWSGSKNETSLTPSHVNSRTIFTRSGMRLCESKHT